MKICRMFANFPEFLYPVTRNFRDSQILTDSGYGGCQKSSKNFGEIPDFPIWGYPVVFSRFRGHELSDLLQRYGCQEAGVVGRGRFPLVALLGRASSFDENCYSPEKHDAKRRHVC
jgi:hypothetical protein